MCFDGQPTATADYLAEAHLAQMVSIFGPFPTTLLDRSERGYQYFDESGSFSVPFCFTATSNPVLTMVSFIGLLRGDIQFSRRSLWEVSRLAGVLTGQDEEHFLTFIQSMLALEPGERPEARELLNATWLAD